MVNHADEHWFDPLELKVEPLCRAMIDVDPQSPMALGETPWRRPFAAYIKQGWFEGPRLRGRVLPGGGDWPTLSKTGTQAVDARVVWQTDDGALLYLAYGGRIAVPLELQAELADPVRGPAVDPRRYYFRTAPMFETADPRYAWLNDILCIAVGRRTAGGIAYQIYEVK